MAGNGIAVDAFGFLGKPLDKAGRVENLTLGFGKGFALFQREDFGQGVGMFEHQAVPALEQGAAFLGRQAAPARPGRVCRSDGQAGVVGAEVGDLADFFAVGRIENLLIGAVWRVQPLAIDKGLLAE